MSEYGLLATWALHWGRCSPSPTAAASRGDQWWGHGKKETPAHFETRGSPTLESETGRAERSRPTLVAKQSSRTSRTGNSYSTNFEYSFFFCTFWILWLKVSDCGYPQLYFCGHYFLLNCFLFLFFGHLWTVTISFYKLPSFIFEFSRVFKNFFRSCL